MFLIKLRSVITWLKQRGKHVIHLEKDHKKLALGISLGVYIALCPFIGFHTAMVFLCAWLFRLHVGVLLTVSMLINNPWTMVPVYGFGYWFGDWLLNFVQINHHAYNPSWVMMCNSWLQQYIPWEGFSLWAFLVGGNILGILFGLISYPFVKWLIVTFGIRHQERVLRTMMHSRQALYSLRKKAVPMVERIRQKARARRTKYEISSSK